MLVWKMNIATPLEMLNTIVTPYRYTTCGVD
jgi:hypothetical protein